MDSVIEIPNGSILNCYLPKKRGSLKRAIMNAEAKLVKKQGGFEKLLNHTAVIEKTAMGDHLIWEATVFRGVAPTELSRYSQDAFFFVTYPDHIQPNRGLDRIKSQAGAKYDVESWVSHFKHILTGKWKGDTTFKEYSEKWFCSEIVDYGYFLSSEPYMSTPNHVYKYTKHNEIWSGTYADLVFGLKKGLIIIV